MNITLRDADKNEYQTSILFSPPAVLKNFKVLLLTFKDYTDAGAIFDQEEIYSAGDVSAEKPLLVKLTFIGSIPNYGISYEDNSGAVKKFTISQSGFDGSLELTPIK